jgi:aryl-phospho-beta-D-glucosidase BglC (GH1 family)
MKEAMPMQSLLVRAVAVFFAIASIAAGAAGAADAQKIGNVDTSQWRGFNLLEKFTLNQSAPFKEDDFRWIAELGFNFVRLPMDYRCYVEKDDWLKFKEPVLKEIDEAIALGEKYKIHVCLNLHRAPGFCINPPAEKTDLWKDEEALNAFIAHWVMFAKRYKHIPSERLSFNLLNEPMRNTRENYIKVFCRTIEAIQKEDPNRLVMVDGNNVGSNAIPEFLKYANVIQATRGYHPGTISHYKASWAKGSDTWPEPVWPPTARVPSHLYPPTSDPAKKDFNSAMVLRGDFKAGTEIALKILQVSAKAKLVAKAGGNVVAEKTYDPQANPNEWKAVKPDQWTFYNPVGDLEFKVVLPSAAREVSIENVEGDWLTFSHLSIQVPGSQRRSCGTDMAWGLKQTARDVAADGSLVVPPGTVPDQTLIDYLKPWLEISAKGETVFVGEWGCYNKTPHPVALAWMKSWLEQWKKARFGWALWNFRGSFGILDSDRKDIQYEDWHGHKLDREMLKLLQQYQKY